jgi:hypothetical protein
MWKAAQRMDDRTLLLSHIECNYDHQRAFKKIAEEIAACGQEKTPLLEKIRLWYGMGGNMHSIGKMSVSAIIVPTSEVIRSMERRGYVLLEELREALQPLILQYQQLTHKDLDDFYDGDTGTLGPEHMLDVMDSFHRLTPIRQFGQIHWRCPCTWGFRHMACHHTALFSALWDPDVRVPSDQSEVPIPQRKGKTVSTVFNYDKVLDEEECEQQPVWKPKITGIDNPVTPPPAAKRGKGAAQKSKALSDHDKSKALAEPDTDDSDFKIAADAKKGASGRRRKLDLAARPSSQPVLSPSLYIVIYLLTYVPHRSVWMTHRQMNLRLQQALNRCAQYVTMHAGH